MKPYEPSVTAKRAAAIIEKITGALGVTNEACLISNPPNSETKPWYLTEKMGLSVYQTEKTIEELENNPGKFNTDPLTAALAIITLEKAKEDLSREIQEIDEWWIEQTPPSP